jgi:uncharacterized membrane protein YcaP (DUF421 family)
MDLESLKFVLRERDIYSLTDVKDLVFETDGNFSVTTKKNRRDSFILIDNGEVLEDSLKNAGKTKEWLQEKIQKLTLGAEKDIFAVEWTPDKGFYVVDNDGRILEREDRN